MLKKTIPIPMLQNPALIFVLCLLLGSMHCWPPARFGGIPLLVTGVDEDVLERSRTIREMYPRGVDVAVEMTGAKHVIHEAGIGGESGGVQDICSRALDGFSGTALRSHSFFFWERG